MVAALASMTGFSSYSEATDWGMLSWEIRSVNSRYLEANFRLPDMFRQLEADCRSRLKSQLARGKVECFLKFQVGDRLPYQLTVNESLLAALAGAGTLIDQHFSQSQTDVMNVLGWPGVLQTEQLHTTELSDKALMSFDRAIEVLKQARVREGDSLQAFLLERVDHLTQTVVLVESNLPAILKAHRERLLARFESVSVELDPQRLEQELLLVMQKMDVAEEVHRLQSHLQEVVRVIEAGGSVGRRLDFLMQELNREANTLGSKSIDAKMTQQVVELKVTIEQMREQVQNLQ